MSIAYFVHSLDHVNSFTSKEKLSSFLITLVSSVTVPSWKRGIKCPFAQECWKYLYPSMILQDDQSHWEYISQLKEELNKPFLLFCGHGLFGWVEMIFSKEFSLIYIDAALCSNLNLNGWSTEWQAKNIAFLSLDRPLYLNFLLFLFSVRNSCTIYNFYAQN